MGWGLPSQCLRASPSRFSTSPWTRQPGVLASERCLLGHLDDHARSMEYGELELWVIADNERAVALYERSGWQATDDVTIRGSAGRLERRFVRLVPLT